MVRLMFVCFFSKRNLQRLLSPEQIVDETQGQCFRHRALEGKQNIVEPGFDPSKGDISENSPVKISNNRGSSSFS